MGGFTGWRDYPPKEYCRGLFIASSEYFENGEPSKRGPALHNGYVIVSQFGQTAEIAVARREREKAWLF